METFLKQQPSNFISQPSIFALLKPIFFAPVDYVFLYSAALLISFVVLFKSAHFFVVGFVANAPDLNIFALFIGLSIVALGTSVAEIFVAAAATI